MTPSAKATRAAVKGHITRIVQAIKGYESPTMTARISTILIEQEKKLKEKFDTYKALSLKIQDDIAALQATQQEYDAEYDTVCQTEQEVSDARVTIAIKQQEWQEEKEKQKEEARKKLFLDVLQQQQVQNTVAIQQLMANIPAVNPA